MSKLPDPNKIFISIKSLLGLSPTEKFLSKEETYRLYRLVHEQVEQGYKDKSVWAVAFSKSNGDLQKSKALYIELMVERIKDAIEAGKELSELFSIQAEETNGFQAKQKTQPNLSKKRQPLTQTQKKKKKEERLKSLRNSLSTLKKNKKAKVKEGVSKKALDIIDFSITTHTKQIRSLLKELDK
tara:strand:- start:550 stop:1101 length:552 start_codon:yes stop_codon:yes gene_type:complete